MPQNAPSCTCLPVGRGGDECSNSKNLIGRTFSVRVDSDLSGNYVFLWKSRLTPLAPIKVGLDSFLKSSDNRF